MNRFENGEVIVWMQLLGFDRDDADKGVERFLRQTGFVPDAVAALLFHPDFFHQHQGMAEEYVFPPDICAYYGIPRNAERERQPWTNYDLRELARNLQAAGSGLYASVFGACLDNAFHKEWIDDHPEIRMRYRHGGVGRHFVPKRFKDGSYYEDFLIDAMARAVADYGLKGVHLADGYMPAGMTHRFDFSADFVDQFLDHTGFALPDALAAESGSDAPEVCERRSQFIWTTWRAEWIRFHAFRWEGFFTKLCARLHAVGAEVLTLGMYCTDPFETLYCMGIDQKKIVEAGVDRLTANIVPTSLEIAERFPDRHQKLMSIIPTLAAHIPRGRLVTMLGVQDATEEWDLLHHSPTLLERDMYHEMMYQCVDKDGPFRASGGFFICLGDGIDRRGWDWLRERMAGAFSGEIDHTCSPCMLWSDAAHDAMLDAFIQTRRWTPFKHLHEMAEAGARLAGVVRTDGLHHYAGTLLVPNFDMLTVDERCAVTAYDRGAVVATAAPGFDPAAQGLAPALSFTDRFSDYPLIAFSFGREAPETLRREIAALASEDDGRPNLGCVPREYMEAGRYTLQGTLVYSKVSIGFRRALARLLTEGSGGPVQCDKPMIVHKLKNGAYRLYIANPDRGHYARARVVASVEIKETRYVSVYPVLPPRRVDDAITEVQYLYTDDKTLGRSFEIKIAPGGMTILDMVLSDDAFH